MRRALGAIALGFLVGAAHCLGERAVLFAERELMKRKGWSDYDLDRGRMRRYVRRVHPKR